ncbi:hypothetical protein Tco_1468584, partial [Tanacetum coccineum]
PEIATAHATTVPSTISMITPLPQLTTPSPALITVPTTTSIPALPDFSSLYATRTALQSYTKEFEKKAQEKRKLYIDVVEKSVKDIIKDEVKTSLIEFELKKIMLDKLEKSKLYQAADDHRNLYDALVKSYQVDKELFDSYGKAYSLKRSREDKDEDPPAGPDQGLKKKKTSKDADPSRGSKSKVSKSCSFKGTKSLSKSSGKSA